MLVVRGLQIGAVVYVVASILNAGLFFMLAYSPAWKDGVPHNMIKGNLLAATGEGGAEAHFGKTTVPCSFVSKSLVGVLRVQKRESHAMQMLEVGEDSSTCFMGNRGELFVFLKHPKPLHKVSLFVAQEHLPAAPRLIELLVSKEGKKFIFAKFLDLDDANGRQIFYLKVNFAVKAFKLRILENRGAKVTRITRIAAC